MILKWNIVYLLVVVINLIHADENVEIENNLELNVNTEVQDEGNEQNVEESILPQNDIDNSERPHYTEPNDELMFMNSTANETKANSTHKTVLCKPNVGGMPVEIVNGTQLIKILLPDANVTSKESPGECVLILFYAKFCTFSSMAAPHFNALSRAFPDIKMAAIDAMKYHIFNTQNGIVGVPTLLLFHNGRPIGKFNDTDYTLDLYSKFVFKYTGIEAKEKSFVTSTDFAGPVSSTPEKETDYFLGLSWLFIIVCAVYYFSKSRWWKWIVETVQNTWRESEAQHEHNE